jgi:methyl-accepting chemotaxis protein
MKNEHVNEAANEDLGERIKFTNSLRFKFALMLICAVVISAGVVLLVVVPYCRSAIKYETKNYLEDVVTGNGATLEMLRKELKLTDAEALRNAFQDVGLSEVESSYAYVVTKDGTMQYHPTEEKIGQPVENAVITALLPEMQAGNRPEAKTVEYEFNGATKYAAYYVDEACSSVLVVSADESEMLAPITSITRISIIALVVVIVIMACLGFFVSNLFIRPIVDVSGMVRKMAGLDFSSFKGVDKLVHRKDETGLMSRSVVNLRKELVGIVEEIQNKSEELFRASEQLEHDASETAKTVSQVENAVGDIASGATSQAEETQNATENVIDMGNMIEAANQEAEILENNSQQMKSSSNSAMSILTELMEINDKTKNSIQEIYEQTNITNASAQKIKDATTLIASIAEETNLLSLNASIEAARAGEQGRGFAVVAAQIQRLAEQSNESASQIDEITSALIQDSTKAVETMQQVRGIMDEQSDKMLQTDRMFRQVNTGVENALDSVVNITGKTENLDNSRGRVVDVVQNLSAIAQQNAASSEETSASVVEVGNIVVDISSNAAHLKEIAYGLDQSVKKFQL